MRDIKEFHLNDYNDDLKSHRARFSIAKHLKTIYGTAIVLHTSGWWKRLRLRLRYKVRVLSTEEDYPVFDTCDALIKEIEEVYNTPDIFTQIYEDYYAKN